MEKLGKRALLHVANLTVPSFQVVVLKKVNLGCSFCRWKVSQVISRISGLKEYTIDVRNKQVIAVGNIRFHHRSEGGQRDDVKRTKWGIIKRKKAYY